jgi:uncharacterized RDD family membrane protein YckC
MGARESFKQSRFFARTKSGMIATAIISIFYFPLGLFVAGTIICTAGLGLVVWIPIWATMGLFIDGIYYLFKRVTTEKS